MDSIKKITTLILSLAVVAMVLFSAYGVTHAEDDAELSSVTFYVHCYDVGKHALEDLDGVDDVERGFLNSREINTVHYDPSVITVEEMEEALKDARTYSGTVEEE